MAGVLSKLFVRPVGQGAFILGEELLHTNREGNDKTIRWIYDCGTAGKVETINRSIADVTSRWDTSNRLDLLVVSHFDKDHISGLPELLSKYRFERIVMPFMTRFERFFQSIDAIEEMIDDDPVLASQLVRLVDDPASFIVEQGGDGTRLVVVRPSDGGGVPDSRDGPNPDQGEGVRDPSGPVSSSEAAQLSRGGHQLFALNAGDRLSWDGLWEFVPYVDAEAEEHLLTMDDATRTELKGRVEALRIQQPPAGASSKELKDYVRDLKAKIHALRDSLYDTMGRSSTGDVSATRKDIDEKDKNRISLMAYMGPMQLVHGDACLFPCRGIDPQLFETTEDPYQVSARNGVLLTGDADLSSDASVARLSAYFGRERIDTLAVAQIPHHGSKYNSGSGLSEALNAPIYILNADPQRKPTNHPDAPVVAAFQNFFPAKGARVRARTILVNDAELTIYAVSTDGDDSTMLWGHHFRYWLYRYF